MTMGRESTHGRSRLRAAAASGGGVNVAATVAVAVAFFVIFKLPGSTLFPAIALLSGLLWLSLASSHSRPGECSLSQ
jgi:hypothetical protein